MLFANVKRILEYDSDTMEPTKVTDIAVNPDCVAAIMPAEINADWSEIYLGGGTSTEWFLVEDKASNLTDLFCEVKKMGEHENIKSLFAALATCW